MKKNEIKLYNTSLYTHDVTDNMLGLLYLPTAVALQAFHK